MGGEPFFPSFSSFSSVTTEKLFTRYSGKVEIRSNFSFLFFSIRSPMCFEDIIDIDRVIIIIIIIYSYYYYYYYYYDIFICSYFPDYSRTSLTRTRLTRTPR